MNADGDHRTEDAPAVCVLVGGPIVAAPAARPASRAGRRGPMGRGLALGILVVGLIAWTAGVAGIRRGPAGGYMDDGMYLAAAQSLSRGAGYLLPGRPGPPTQSRYPIGLSGVVAAVLWLAPGEPSVARDEALGRAVVVASAWAFFLLAYGWLRRLRVPRGWALPIVLATAFHPDTIDMALAIMADLPFCAVVYLLLYRCAGRPAGAEGGGRDLLDGAIAGAGALVRSNGVTLVLAALAGSAAGRRRWRTLMLVALGVALALGPARAFVATHGGAQVHGSYALNLSAGWSSPERARQTLTTNLTMVALEWPLVVGPALAYVGPVARLAETWPVVGWGLRLAIGLVGLVGAARLLRGLRRRDVPAWVHAGGTLGLFLVWPWELHLRFILSLFPMLLLAFGTGAAALGRRAGLGPRAAGRLGGLALLAALVGVGGTTAGVFRTAWLNHGHWPWTGGAAGHADVAATLDFLRGHLESEAIVVTEFPEMVYFYTGRRAYPLLGDDEKVLRRFGRPERLREIMDLCPGRPFYLLGSPPDAAGDPTARHLAGLARVPGLMVREVYRAPGGTLWLATIAGPDCSRP